jgi:hypothetical protein
VTLRNANWQMGSCGSLVLLTELITWDSCECRAMTSAATEENTRAEGNAAPTVDIFHDCRPSSMNPCVVRGIVRFRRYKGIMFKNATKEVSAWVVIENEFFERDDETACLACFADSA